MSVKEIVFVIVLVSAFILLIYFQIRITAYKKPRARPIPLRILEIASGIFIILLPWLLASSILPKIMLTVFGIHSLYRASKGWLFKSNESLPPTPSQSQD